MRTNNLLADLAVYLGGGGAVCMVEQAIVPPRLPPSPLSPPRSAIGAIWTALFAAMGVARSRVPREERRSIDRLWLLCLGYPLYSLGQRWRAGGLLGNVAVGAVAGAIAAKIERRDPIAAALIAPIVPWTVYASLILLTDRQKNA